MVSIRKPCTSVWNILAIIYRLTHVITQLIVSNVIIVALLDSAISNNKNNSMITEITAFSGRWRG